MKTRYGFISNSSSTSFYIPESGKEEAKRWDLTLVPVKDIIKAMEILEPVDFMLGWSGSANEYLDKLKKLGDGYITGPYDRDMAYEFGLDDAFGAFKSDL